MGFGLTPAEWRRYLNLRAEDRRRGAPNRSLLRRNDGYIIIRTRAGLSNPAPPPLPGGFTADVWVAKAGDGGSDSNDGLSEGAPKLTINAGMGVLAGLGAAKKMAIKQGTYSEDIGDDATNLPPSGTSFNNLTRIVAYPSHTVTINGSGTSAGPCKFYSTARQYVSWEDLIFVNRALSTSNPATEHGNGGDVFILAASGFFNFLRCDFVDGESTGGVTISDNGALHVGGHRFIDCNVYNCGNNTQFDHGVYCKIVDNACLFQGGSYHNNAGSGLNFYASGGGAQPGCRVIGAKIYNNNLGMFVWDQSAPFLANLLIHHNADTGISLFSGTSNSELYNLTVCDNGANAGIEVESTSTVKNCIAYNNGGTDITAGGTQSNNWVTADGNPNFVGGTNYHLTASSSNTLRNGGATIGSVTDDLDGVSRPAGAYSIGCYEIG